MNDEHVYVDGDGTEWERVYTSPQAAADTKVDPFSKKQFLDKTRGAGTLGDLWDRGREMSEMRAAEAGGVDPVRQKSFKEWSEKRGGRKHPQDNS